jgi:hypothetical protein
VKFFRATFEETMCRAIVVNQYTRITDFQYNDKDAWLPVRAKMAEKPED